MPPKPLKLVILSDIHLGADKESDGHYKRLPSRALSLVRYLVTKINSEIRPDLVIQLGDLIEDEDAETDAENYETALSALKFLRVPLFHVVGNREQVNMTAKDIGTMLDYPRLCYSFDVGAFHFVVLFATATTESGIHIDDAQRQWLAADLAATDKPTLVFSHHPLDEQDLEGSQFADQANSCFVEERQQIRDILAKSGKVRAVFSSHVHRNNLESIESIGYVTLQSLVENMSETRKVASESYAIVTVREDEIRVEIEGNDPAEYVI